MRKFIWLFLALALAPRDALAVTPVCGTADDTASVQAAINSLLVDLPQATCKVRELDGTFRPGLTIQGTGLNSALVPIQSGVNVLDLTGTTHATLKSFRICGICLISTVPKMALLLAQGVGAPTSDVFTMINVRIDGCFGLAAIYNLQVASSSIIASQIWADCGMTIIHTGNNFFGVSSKWTTINNANDLVPSDWSLYQTEIHNLGNSQALWLGGMQSHRMYGGNIASSATPVSINPVMINGVITYPDNLIFDGTTFYADFPPTPTCAIQNNAGALGVPQFRANRVTMPTKVC